MKALVLLVMTSQKIFPKLITLTFSIFVPTMLLAHGSHGSGVMAGFTHPILGVDHNVAILVQDC